MLVNDGTLFFNSGVVFICVGNDFACVAPHYLGLLDAKCYLWFISGVYVTNLYFTSSLSGTFFIPSRLDELSLFV